MFIIKVNGSVFKLHQRNELVPTIFYFESKEKAQNTIDYWDSSHSTFNHSLFYNYKKDKKGRDVCEYIYTRDETVIEEV